MFEGEFESLDALQKTETVQIPHPIKVLDRPTGPGTILVMEYLDLKKCAKQAELGSSLARLHLANLEKRNNGGDFVEQFGFDIETCCGFLPQGNQWHNNWDDFYTEKLDEQISRQKDGELHRLWAKIKPGISTFFNDLNIFPSLLHGDLWNGNIAQFDKTPVVFDPASFYGHHEYDLAIGQMFGGFDGQFYQAYHQAIPKQEGFEERSDLYQLFHYLNHWNHFGGGYKAQSLEIMRRLANYIN
eukprot:GFUD01002179.1.p1 GENE.GFUD01002179.1~~GFUD01002179.1.p1  ORF type:complete len:243 (+),score=54.24 GFUD01002179.1:176-904(+)